MSSPARSPPCLSREFRAIGHDPRSELVRESVEVDADGCVLVRDRTTATVARRLLPPATWDRTYRQAITAAGSGCAAAIDAERWLAHPHASETAREMIGAQ